jgi:hypothetical protein
MENLAHHALRSSLTLACLPSLAVAATHQVHDRQVADEVTDNIRSLGDFVLRTPLRRHQTDKIKGQLSEIAVTGVLWWGIANGNWPETDYILPATRSQDRGDLNGRRNGIDLLWRLNGKSRQGVQVKTRFSQYANSYRPDILVLAASSLTSGFGAKHEIPNITLLQALTQNRERDLTRAQQRISTLVEQTASRARDYRATKVAVPKQVRLTQKRTVHQS